MRKLKIYVETSVWSFLIANKILDRQSVTAKFFEQVKAHKIYISPLVILEIERTPEEEIRRKLKDAIAHYNPEILEETEEILLLSDKYLSHNIMPEKYRNDAVHIAYATFYELDAIVSWNLRHIVKMRTRRMVNYTNMLEGYKLIEIVTPEEVIEYEE